MISRQNQQNCLSCNRKIDRGCLLNCSKCKERFHYTCLNIDSAKFREHQDELKRTVLCPSCSEAKNRNSPAVSIPSKTTKVSENSKHFDSSQVAEKLKGIKEELASYRDAFDYFDKQFDDLKKSVAEKDEKINYLQKDNLELHGVVKELTHRLGSIEQFMREDNIEVNGIPENRSENLTSTLIKIGETVGFPLADNDIQNITRVAKLDKKNSRPRAVIAKLRNVRQRDSFLAAVSKFNKNKRVEEKFNSQQIGISGSATPIYVSEHLTPANKSLHAATRKKAKEMKYKFTWQSQHVPSAVGCWPVPSESHLLQLPQHVLQLPIAAALAVCAVGSLKLTRMMVTDY
ncbi:hypothetical protein NE865_00013 [Phthorimaea operculella]|nr:hypothetical protein NE865_00013 [Phthorimaea operculella]